MCFIKENLHTVKVLHQSNKGTQMKMIVHRLFKTVVQCAPLFSVDWTSLHRTDVMMLFLRLKKANSSGMNPIAHLKALHKCILNGMVHKVSISWMFGALAKENRYVLIHVFFISHGGKSEMISLDLLFFRMLVYTFGWLAWAYFWESMCIMHLSHCLFKAHAFFNKWILFSVLL